jgi:predicted O-methyltransferase YrrM
LDLILKTLQQKDYHQILSLVDQFSDPTYSNLIIVGILYELIDQHHRAVDAYKKADILNSTLFSKLSIARAHGNISHWERAIQLFREFTKEEFVEISNNYHKGLVTSFLPFYLQQMINHFFGISQMNSKDKIFGILSECRVNEIQEAELLLEDQTLNAIIALLLKKPIHSLGKTILQEHGISKESLDGLNDSVNTENMSVHSWISTTAHQITHNSFSKLDLYDGWLTKLEGRVLYTLAKNTPQDHNIVEIGAWKGKSSSFLAEGSLAGKCAKIYSVDPHQWSDDILVENTFQYWISLMKKQGYSKIIQNVREYSSKATKCIPDNIYLLFIDGDHSSKSVREDILLWCPKVVDGGYILFHDSFFQSVFIVLEELIWSNHIYKIIDVIEGMLIVQKIKSNTHKSRSQEELRLWIYLQFRRNKIRNFLMEIDEALISHLISELTNIY